MILCELVTLHNMSCACNPDTGIEQFLCRRDTLPTKYVTNPPDSCTVGDSDTLSYVVTQKDLLPMYNSDTLSCIVTHRIVTLCEL